MTMLDNTITNDFFKMDRMKSGEKEVLESIGRNFESFPAPIQRKLENFALWVRHRDIARFLFKVEIFKEILNVPGVVFECGVLYGGTVATWSSLSEIFEPVNFSRRIFGFDTFQGFPIVTKEDVPKGARRPERYEEGFFNVEEAKEKIFEALYLADQTRKVPQLPRINLVEGDVRDTVPRTLKEDKSILVSLLYLDLDLFEPTKAVLEACLPRMPKGSIIVFDELCFEDWPGETLALTESFDLNDKELVRCPYVPNISYLRV